MIQDSIFLTWPRNGISPSDQLTYTFHLRDNLKFSDGSPLTADDVAFSLTLLNDPAYSGGSDFSDIGIKGVDAYKSGKADSISGIRVIDERTITIETTKVNPLTLGVLGGQVLSKSYYGKDYQRGHLDYLKDLYGKPLGAGPYKLSKYVDGQEVRYVANKYYYGGEPKIRNLILRSPPRIRRCLTSRTERLTLMVSARTRIILTH